MTIQKAQTTPLDPELLREALTIFADLPEEDRRSMEGRAFAIFRMLDARGDVAEKDRWWVATAIEWRLEALSRLAERPEFKAYALGPTKDGADFIHADMIDAAAQEPLMKLDKYTLVFDPDRFFQRVLSEGRTDGTG